MRLESQVLTRCRFPAQDRPSSYSDSFHRGIEVGDWFSVIAMFILAGEASGGSPLAIAGVLAARSFT
ncbi:MAG TPA: hypothetical protein QF487_07035, partial [Acidimicrobiales bacterium]|nr:hypothetical protein [Acidimicrobiales bacterium]